MELVSQFASWVRRQGYLRPEFGNYFEAIGMCYSFFNGLCHHELRRGHWNGATYDPFMAEEDGWLVPCDADPGYDVVHVRHFESARTTPNIKRFGDCLKCFKVPREIGLIYVAKEFGGYDNGADVGLAVVVLPNVLSTSELKIKEAVDTERFHGKPLKV